MSQSRGPDSTASGFFSITPHDTTALQQPTRAIHVGGAGNVRAKNDAGAWVTFKGLAAGALLPIRTQYVSSTGTTATDLVGLA